MDYMRVRISSGPPIINSHYAHLMGVYVHNGCKCRFESCCGGQIY